MRTRYKNPHGHRLIWGAIFAFFSTFTSAQNWTPLEEDNVAKAYYRVTNSKGQIVSYQLLKNFKYRAASSPMSSTIDSFEFDCGRTTVRWYGGVSFSGANGGGSQVGRLTPEQLGAQSMGHHPIFGPHIDLHKRLCR